MFLRILAVFLGLTSSFLLAKTLSLEEVFELAKQNVGSIEAQKAQIDVSVSQLKLTEAGFYPAMGFSFSYTRQAIPDSSSNSAVSAFVNPNQFLTKLTLGIPSLQGFREITAYRASRANVKVQELNLKVVEMNLFIQVSMAYYSLLGSRKDLDDLQSLVKIAQDRVSQIQRFVSLGKTREADLYAQQAQLALLQAQLKQAQEMVKINKHALVVMTGMTQEDEVEEHGVSLPQNLEPIEEYLKLIDTRPDIKSLKAQVGAAYQNKLLSLGGHFPTLGLLADYYPYRTGVLQAVPWDLGLSVNIPLFQGFGVMAQTQQLSATERALKYTLLQAERDAQRQIRLYYDTLNSAIQTVSALEKAVKFTEKTYWRQELDYRHKMATNLDVNTSMTQMATVIRTRDQMLYQGKSAQAGLKAATGKIP